MNPEPQFPMHIVEPAGVALSSKFDFTEDVCVEADRANPGKITALHAQSEYLGHSSPTNRATYLAETIWPDVFSAEPGHDRVQAVEARELGRWVVAAECLLGAAPGTFTARAWALDLAKATLWVEAFFPSLRAAEHCAELVGHAESNSSGSRAPLPVSRTVYERVRDDYLRLAKAIDPEQFVLEHSLERDRKFALTTVERTLSLLEDAATSLLADLSLSMETEVPAEPPRYTISDLESTAREDLAAGARNDELTRPDRQDNTRAVETLVAGTLRKNDLLGVAVRNRRGQWRSRISVSGPGVNELELWMKAYDEQDSLVAMAPVRWADGQGSGACAFVLAPQTVPRFVLTDAPHQEETPASLRVAAQAGRQAGSVRMGVIDPGAWLEIASLWQDIGDPDRALLACWMGRVLPEHRRPEPPMISAPGIEEPGMSNQTRRSPVEEPEPLEPWEDHLVPGVPSATSELDRFAAKLTPTWVEERKFWAHDAPFIAEEIHAGLSS
jgi:hypothetical protein